MQGMFFFLTYLTAFSVWNTDEETEKSQRLGMTNMSTGGKITHIPIRHQISPKMNLLWIDSWINKTKRLKLLRGNFQIIKLKQV